MSNESLEFQEKVPSVIEAFFAQIANVLNDFALNHNLMLERYYHEAPCWKFNFKHPKGGVGSIDVMRESDDSLKIYDHWWIDDFDKFVRFFKTEVTPEYKIDSINLVETLEEHLKGILSWRTEELTRGETDFEPYWKPYKKIFLNDVERYPRPNV